MIVDQATGVIAIGFLIFKVYCFFIGKQHNLFDDELGMDRLKQEFKNFQIKRITENVFEDPVFR
ncbi:hypothetical protein [Holdemania massiliensis]|uniref:hypothetical protein n=1 Tax=Holdemania massiliensis TaxID=1468449 RepID=UPI0012B60A48|nr:hypothetical protein [Holdemania massiliensis]